MASGERSLRDLFHLLSQVVPEDQEPASIAPRMSVSDALALMAKENYSQLPVVQGKEVLGAFTYRSLAQGLKMLPTSERDLLALPVEEFLEDLTFARISDKIEALHDELDLKDAVFVGRQDNLLGVVTTIDALRYFYRVASPYVLLREIELAIRELLRSSQSAEGLAACMKRALAKICKERDQPVPTKLEELSLNDYVMLLRHKENWECFKPAFGGTANTTYAKLRRVPGLRNDVFHFRRELTLEEYQSLRETRDWLLRRIRVCEAQEQESAQ